MVEGRNVDAQGGIGWLFAGALDTGIPLDHRVQSGVYWTEAIYGRIAQWLERSTHNGKCGGSNPSAPMFVKGGKTPSMGLGRLDDRQGSNPIQDPTLDILWYL